MFHEHRKVVNLFPPLNLPMKRPQGQTEDLHPEERRETSELPGDGNVWGYIWVTFYYKCGIKLCGAVRDVRVTIIRETV